MSQFLSSNEMFINIKDAPRWDPKKNYFDQEISTLDFYEQERRKITEGVMVNGYYVHPWLYWHINFFKTPIPVKNAQGRDVEKIMCPPIDDNFLYMIENYKYAEDNSLGLCLFGSRGYSKSTILSSLITWINSIRANGTTSVIGGSDLDLKAISKLIQTGFNKVNPAFFIPQLISEWDSLVEIGLKEKDGFRLPHSHISITNANKGTAKSSEKGAGLSPVGFILDEALHEDSLLYYVNGEYPIKNVQVGDFIYGKNGKLTEVLEKINPGIVDLFEITLSDGRKVKASENHLWTVYNVYLKRWVELTTLEIFSKYYFLKYDKRNGKHSKSSIYSIPLNAPIEYENKELLIDTYWLGLYLGDGFTSTTIVCSEDLEILEYCKNYATTIGMEYSESNIKSCDNPNFKIINIITKVGKRKYNKNKLKELIKSYGIYNEKRIPKDYLYSSIEDRIQLLRGIMDTDGSISKSGSIEFSTSIYNFANDFEFLCRSLGMSVIRTTKKTSYKNKLGEKVDCKLAYRFSIKTNINPFKLSRKRIYFESIVLKSKKKSFNTNRERISIVNIEKSEKAQAYCIKVKSDDKLFITDNFVVTHNCGKFNFKEILISALPSFITPTGAKLVHVLSGTSGNEELSKDAKEVLTNPEDYSLITMDWDKLERNVDPEYITWERSKKQKFSVFVPAQMSYRLAVPKVETTLDKHLNIKNEGLSKIKINITDWKTAKEVLTEKLNSLKKEESKEKQRMYYPLEIDDVFLTSSSNPFPTALIDKRIRFLEDEGLLGKNIEVYRHNGKIMQEFSPKKRAEVSHPGGEADAPAILFADVPEVPPTKFTYVSGLDDYKLDQSETSSLGAFYIIKRRNLEPNSPCEKIVLSHTTRPFRHGDFHKDCEKHIDIWNSLCNMEAVDVSFKQHLDTKNKSEQCLATSISFSNSVQSGNYKLTTKFGVYPTAGNKSYMFNLVVDFTKEEHVVGIDEDGNEIVKHGVDFIDDIDLLKEMLSFKKGGNFDRITAYMHALAYARELDKLNIRPIQKEKENNKMSFQGSDIRSRPNINIFSNVKLKIF